MTQEQITHENGKKLLFEICGARLSSVQFVLDYLILGFDERGALTTLVWPEITNKETTVTFGMQGYRDRLCTLIKKVVENVEISGETIVITFDDGTRLAIPLHAYKGSGERAIFTAPKNRLFVW